MRVPNATATKTMPPQVSSQDPTILLCLLFPFEELPLLRVVIFISLSGLC